MAWGRKNGGERDTEEKERKKGTSAAMVILTYRLPPLSSTLVRQSCKGPFSSEREGGEERE